MPEISLTILCEGQTEARFVSSILRPYLKERSIFVKSVELNGSPSLKQLKNQVESLRSQHRGHAHISTMIDYYKQRLLSNEQIIGRTPFERVQYLEAEIAQRIAHSNFLPYLQLHEFEALLLTDLNKLQFAFPDEDVTNQLLGLRKDLGNKSPEEVNDGENTAPSKRIAKFFPEYELSKPAIGPNIAKQIGLDMLRNACPHFDEWVTKLENLSV